jgi:hypothetical protein
MSKITLTSNLVKPFKKVKTCQLITRIVIWINRGINNQQRKNKTS